MSFTEAIRCVEPVWTFRRVHTPANRQDIELLVAGLPEPIDLNLDRVQDRRDPSSTASACQDNAVNLVPMEAAPGNYKDPRDRFHSSDGGNCVVFGL